MQYIVLKFCKIYKIFKVQLYFLYFAIINHLNEEKV